ncbi:MAG: DUF2294 domain-containing protein [Candidatus Carbobacillus altaicus]|nr:DUF2294 domain-containing protein [Candidatus Carbobacillus altaicus]
MSLTKGELEDKISKAVTQWEKEYLGRGSVKVKTDILRNMVIIVLKGILTPAEKKVAETQEGMLSIKKARTELVESGKEQLKELISALLGIPIYSFHTDLSTRTGERVMIFMLERSFDTNE